MPATKAQMRTAGRELRLRREGKVVQEANRKLATRPMGSMSTENLRKYARHLDKEIEKLSGWLKQSGNIEHALWLIRAKKQKESGR